MRGVSATGLSRWDDPSVTPTSPKLAQVLSKVAETIQSDFEESRLFSHSASKGTTREALVMERFLDKYLPRNVSTVHGGEVLSVNGDMSAQCDVLVLDPVAPYLLDKADYKIVAVEAVYGVVEVKSFLSSDELKAAFRKIAHLKSMPKTAFQPVLGPTRSRNIYGRQWDYVPVTGMIFAYDGASLRTLGNAMAEVALEYADQPHLMVDSVWVLNKGCLVWCDPNTHRINPGPEPGDAFQAIEADAGQVLMQWAAHLHEHFATAWSTGFKLRDYFGQASWGTHLMAWSPDPSPDEPTDPIQSPKATGDSGRQES